jgi:hypothetical protein
MAAPAVANAPAAAAAPAADKAVAHANGEKAGKEKRAFAEVPKAEKPNKDEHEAVSEMGRGRDRSCAALRCDAWRSGAREIETGHARSRSIPRAHSHARLVAPARAFREYGSSKRAKAS